MAAETVSNAVQGLAAAAARMRASGPTDNLKRAGESGAPTTRTTTIVETIGADPSATTCTVDVTTT